jgi:GNAT superfamily N-acetyltransferase
MSQQNVELVRGVQIDLSRRHKRAGNRRSLDEHLFVRFPAAFRLLARAFARLPPRSRLRRLMLARTFRRTYAAGNRRDFAVLRVGLDRDFEFRPARRLLGLDQDPVFYGYEGYLRVWRHWLDAFEDLKLEPEECLDFGEKLLVTAHARGHGVGSRVAMDQPVLQLYHLRRGLAVKQEDFTDRSRALEAAGLRE